MKMASRRHPAGQFSDCKGRGIARFRFEAELLSDDAHIALKAMMGRMVTISMLRDDGTLRYFNGYVGEFCLLRADGGFAWYRMVLQPWLAFARLRQDNVSFMAKA